MYQFYRIVSASLFFFGVGCASSYRRVYDGPALPRNEIAVIWANSEPLGGYLSPSFTDDEPTPMATLLEVRPGHHRLCISWVTQSGGTTAGSKDCAMLDFEALPGHTYELYAVRYTWPKWKWSPTIVDITNELQRPEMADRAKWLVSALNKHRETGMLVPEPSPLTASSGPAMGFGEMRTATITGDGDQPVQVRYQFDRHKPYVLVEGSDNKDYHLEISQQTGEVTHVFGMQVTFGKILVLSPGMGAFQPLGSDYVVLCKGGNIWKVYREAPLGTYTHIENPDPTVLPPCGNN